MIFPKRRHVTTLMRISKHFYCALKKSTQPNSIWEEINPLFFFPLLKVARAEMNNGVNLSLLP